MGKEQAKRHVEMPPLKLCRSGAMPTIQCAALPPPHPLLAAFHTN